MTECTPQQTSFNRTSILLIVSAIILNIVGYWFWFLQILSSLLWLAGIFLLLSSCWSKQTLNIDALGWTQSMLKSK